jgi:hypothetical protein
MKLQAEIFCKELTGFGSANRKNNMDITHIHRGCTVNALLDS